MRMLLAILVLACSMLSVLACYGNGCGGQYNFHTCSQAICHNGKYVGYGCRHGVCPFVCHGAGCQNARISFNSMNPSQLRNSALYGNWGTGAYGYRGCFGGNCGFWGGCMNGQCGGFYDFRRCNAHSCLSGPYHGYGCNGGVCRYICFGGMCHTPYAYGLGCYGPSCDGYYQFPKLNCEGPECYGYDEEGREEEGYQDEEKEESKNKNSSTKVENY
ncbi:unnamed protein product [Rodentolepis nana]|uniref:EGF-like domain-containing protein n=1 Tax=Rodentolepis nana TaxID=102285 RepID=A0A0R3TA20_RODNA|nr:unnamed protein product [Rodentolepis nana]